MADAEYDSLQIGAAPASGALQRTVTLAGAMTSLALLVGFGVWGYRLAVRDVTGVPVIQALDGPMRIAPADPGGEIADHQGLAVNEVAAEGVAAPPPERLVLAPRPMELAPEDVAGLADLPPLTRLPVVAPGEAAPAGDLALAAAPPVESASPTAIAVDAALSEALGLPPDPVPEAEPVADLTVELAAVDGAMTASPRPQRRPARSDLPADPAAATIPAPPEVDPATIPVGTRLVQFGAYDTEAEARAAWMQLAGQFGDLMADKRLVLQPAESGGRTFYRLRAHGFDGEDDARRFCTAFVARDATCIPVPQR
jgi:hypothetical protein